MKIKVDKNNILRQMFDIRPLNERGVLDTKKILSAGGVLDARAIEEKKSIEKRRYLLDLGDKGKKEETEKNLRAMEDVYKTERDITEQEAERFKFFHEAVLSGENKTKNNDFKSAESKNNFIKEGDAGLIGEDNEDSFIQDRPIIIKEENFKKDLIDFEKFKEDIIKMGEGAAQSISSAVSSAVSPVFYHWKKSLAAFAAVCLVITSSVGALAFYQKSSEKADSIKELATEGFYSILDAKDDLENKEFLNAREDFESAFEKFKKAEGQITPAENMLAKIPDLFGQTLPSSGIRLVKAGKNISKAGSEICQAFSPLFEEEKKAENLDILKALELADKSLKNALAEIKEANAEVKEIDIAGLPENIKDYGQSLKDILPDIQNILGKSVLYADNILKILGSDNPRQYLFLFQNNAEIRATGGFIGSFAAADVYKGKLSALKVDGIYNPAGQLIDKVVPPLPFKKVTDKWNIFDANYFADFPASAKKIAWFYEKTGGATVDGIITFTPKVLEDLLGELGPIAMPEYDAAINKNNFVEIVQFEVEENYNKEENKPKKIIGDLAQKILDRLLSSSREDWIKLLDVLRKNLNEKHILIYLFREGEERMIQEEGWSGSVLQSQQDYLQVVHTNINGYKTDRKIQEKIKHQINIEKDGSVIDTVTISKKHNGGDTGYDWYDRQNGDFLRVYVPVGSEFISAEGFSTEEIYSKTKDFSGFTADPDVYLIERNMSRDEKSGVFIFEESEKSVFGGWMYTDPGEISTVKITYKLPFKISPEDSDYNILYQKQSGHPGVQLTTEIYNSGKLVEEKVGNLVEDEVELKVIKL